MRYIAPAILFLCIFVGRSAAQAPGKVDFRRDVQPLFQQYCISCHGPSQQMNGFRLDRRRDAMRGGTGPVIGAGDSAASRLYLRLLGNDYGPQMPPTGPLSPEHIAVIKGWIDQGAEWPDDLAGETPATPLDPQASRIMEALRFGDAATVRRLVKTDPKIVNLKGAGGSTPLMYAVLYGNLGSVRLMLDNGADPSIRNDVGATALMWAVDDAEKTELLLERGADPNARSNDRRTPLIIAAGRFGSSAVVKQLLDRGADPSVKSLGTTFGEMTPLTEAACAGDEAIVRMLIARGADVKASGVLPLYFALATDCAKCADALIGSLDRDSLNAAMFLLAPPLEDGRAIRTLIDRGADATAKDPAGRTVLMLAAHSDALPAETVKALIERGADVNAKSLKGETALGFAKQRGQTKIVDLLVGAGAKEAASPQQAAPKLQPAGSIRGAVQRSIPLLQRTDVTFFQKSGCVSCHNNTLTAMTIATARTNGVPVNDQIASQQLRAFAAFIDGWRERALQGIGIPGDTDTVSSILVGMAAENHPPDAATDALAHYLKNRQLQDGRWRIIAHRPPLESSDVQATATAIRALQVYAPKARRAEYDQVVQRAAGWLSKVQPTTTEERVFQLLGLKWAGVGNGLTQRGARDLLVEQRTDGGWGQLSTLPSDAYATGQALVALRESGVLAVTAPAYEKGIEFLLSTQLEDGSWRVKTRSLPLQPLFESGFPHGLDQWVSVAGTNWATRALAHAAR